MQMQVEDPYHISADLQQQISSLSSDQHYFLIYPTLKMEQTLTFTAKFSKVPIPYLLVFTQNDETELASIIEQFLEETNVKLNLADIRLTLQKGTILNKAKMGELKRQLRIDTLDGLRIFYSARDMSIAGQSFQQECALKTIITCEDTYNNKDVQATFRIASTNYYFYLPIDGSSGNQEKAVNIYKKLLQSVSGEIEKVYGVKIDANEILLTVNVNGVDKQIRSSNIYSISKKSRINVTFKKQIKLPSLLSQQINSYVIFKGEGVQPITFAYEQIKMTKVGTLFRDFFGFEEQNKKSNEYGLRIFEVVVKPCECLSQFPEIQSVFSNLNTAFKFIHANIIRESDIFAVHQAQIANLPYFNFDTIVDMSDKKNAQHREICRQKIRNRAEKIKIPYFKNVNNIEPIFLYTSDLKVKQSKGISTLYNTVNTFLRSQNFGQTERKQYQKWEYLFSNRLLTQLKEAPLYSGNVLYRGIKYTPKYKVGEVVEFKQFSSSSKKKQIALSFAEIGLIYFKNYKKGRLISQLSYYENEEEVLIMPYSRFRVTSINKNVENPTLNCRINTYEMEAIPEEELAQPTCVIVLWVDDKTGLESQGYRVCKSFSMSRTNTFIYHFKSTALLQSYLKNNKKTLNDPTVQTVMITNMARMQPKGKNDTAGIDALKVFRSCFPKSYVFFYVGYLPATFDNLKKNNFAPSENLLVSNNLNDLIRFFRQVLMIM